MTANANSFTVLTYHRLRPSDLVNASVSRNVVGIKHRGMGRTRLSGGVSFIQRSYASLSFTSRDFSTIAMTFNVHGFRKLSGKLSRVYHMLGANKRLIVLRLSAPSHFPVGRLFAVCSGIIVPLLNGYVSGSGDTCACLPRDVHTFPRKRIVRRMVHGTNFDRIRFGQLAFKVYALCITAGWGRRACVGGEPCRDCARPLFVVCFPPLHYQFRDLQ